jgi:hypothetical protein
MLKLLKIFERTVFIFILVLVVIIPLLPKFPLIDVAGTFVAVRMEDFLIALVLLIWGIYIILSRRVKELLHDKLIQAILLFFFIGALSTISAAYLTQTVNFQLSLLHFLRRVEFILLLPVVYSVVKTQKQIKITLGLFSIVAFLVTIYAIGQQYLGWPVISTTNSEFSKGLVVELTPGGRVNSTFAGHYDLAIFLMMVLSILAAVVFTTRNIMINSWYFVLGGLSAFVLVLTAARFSFFGAVFGILSAFLLTKKRLLVLLTILVTGAILIYPSQLRDRLISTLTVNFLNIHSATYEEKGDNERNKLNLITLPPEGSRGATVAWNEDDSTPSGYAPDIAPGEPTDPTELGVYRSFAIRLNVEWPRAINAFLRNPLLGSGYSSIGIATDNDYLRSLGEVGILGTLAFALFIFECIKRVFKNFQKENRFVKYFSAGVLAMVIAFLLNGIFIDVFEASKVAAIFWLILGLNLSLYKEESHV